MKTEFAGQVKHPSYQRLEEGLPHVLDAPKDCGLLKAIVIRPTAGTRQSLDTCELSAERGVHGDRWADGCWMTLEDGQPHPDVQVSIMSARMIAAIAAGQKYWQLAGDNLFVDLDISPENLPPGQRLELGSAILEITAVPHNACAQFCERYGEAATKFINSPQGRRLRLRGVFAKIVKDGRIAVGDEIRKSCG